MALRSMRACVDHLSKHGHLVTILDEVDPYLEMAAIHRRVFQAGGPAIFFANIKGSSFPAVSNLFGTMERSRFLFRSTLAGVQQMIRIKADPKAAMMRPLDSLRAAFAGLHALPLRPLRAPVLQNKTKIEHLPAIQSWPDDGGPFITLPIVYSEHAKKSGIMASNLGMYRIQLSGNRYRKNEQIGLHYQIHRGIGVHHASALEEGKPFRVSVFVGGPPAHTFAAVMPLPDGLPEVAFAGALAGRNFRYRRINGGLVSTDADFCITGIVENKTLPEGPFGDHLGYYSLRHNFPVLRVENVYHRTNAVWPFTVVGRPPQEDTMFGAMIHEIVEPMVPVTIPGLRAMHAVDAAGVHPLMLAIGSERYTPYEKRKPQEILTIANAILGFSHASLAKFLFIIAGEDDPSLDIHDVSGFFQHVLERADWTRDLHFQTRTTMDTLDYTGTGINEGSKLVIAAAGPAVHQLAREVRPGLKIPRAFRDPYLALPGTLAISGPDYQSEDDAVKQIDSLCRHIGKQRNEWAGIRLIVVCDDSEFAARTLSNFLWVTFTRANPSHDVHGVESFYEHKHWGCAGPLVIDARRKPHHAPPLIEDPAVEARVDQLGAPGGSLHGII